MKILFVGLGGAGQRHLRIFKNLLSNESEFSAYRTTNTTPYLNPDFTVNREKSIEKEYNVAIHESLEEAMDSNPNLIVISTPTSLHYDVAIQAAKKGLNMLIEKPFSNNLDKFDEFSKLIFKKNISLFISFQRRFHPFIQKIKNLLEMGSLGKILSANFHIYSYVPFWHPYENFHQLYACKKELGGGVLLTEIHELDICCWYFGMPEYVYCTGGNWSNECLDVEDTAHIILEYKSFAVQLSLCFMSQNCRRKISIDCSKGSVEWSEKDNKLICKDYTTESEEVFQNTDLTNDTMFISQAKDIIKKIQSGIIETNIDMAKNPIILVLASKKSMDLGTKIKIQDYF